MVSKLKKYMLNKLKIAIKLIEGGNMKHCNCIENNIQNNIFVYIQ